ncbi:MAG: polyprenyl synthetase family protein [Candidatus Diapherotrites archaeon]
MQMNINDFLKEKKPLIDAEMEKVFPRKLNNKWLSETLGKADYACDFKTINKSLSEPIWDFLDRGGKRWRPALMLLTCDAVGGNSKKIMPFTALPELVHTGTIMVDDVEDNSDQRRGKPCTHKLYGTDVAVNAANAMYFLPLTLLYNNPLKLKESKLVEIYNLYSEELIKVSVGQAMDIQWHRNSSCDVSEEQYLQMCVYKTGVLARFSAKLGAILGNADAKQINALGKFGESLGVAFQIQDDILNIAPVSKDWGKEIGDDINEGKKTLLVIYALKKLNKADSSKLKEILNMHTKDQKLISEAIELIKKSGAVEYAKKKASEIGSKGWKHAESVLDDSPAKNRLHEFSEYVTKRKY